VGGDDNHRGIRVLLHNPSEIIQSFAAVGRGSLEIEVEEDGVGPFALEQRKQLGGRGQGFDPFEQVAQSKAGRERDIGIIVDDYSEAERLFHRVPA